MHAITISQADTHTHMHTHNHTHTHTGANTYATHTNPHTHINTAVQKARNHAVHHPACTHSRAHTHTRTQTHTQNDTHTNKHRGRIVSPAIPLGFVVFDRIGSQTMSQSGITTFQARPCAKDLLRQQTFAQVAVATVCSLDAYRVLKQNIPVNIVAKATETWSWFEC